MSLCLQSVGETHSSLHSKWFSKRSSFARKCVSQNSIDLTFGNRLLMHVYLYSGFPSAGTPRPSPPPSVCIWRKSVSESASGTWSRMVAWEQISCSCVYLVLTVHTGFFFHCPWAYQHAVSLLRGLYLLASGLKMWRHTIYKAWLKSECFEILNWLMKCGDNLTDVGQNLVKIWPTWDLKINHLTHYC